MSNYCWLHSIVNFFLDFWIVKRHICFISKSKTLNTVFVMDFRGIFFIKTELRLLPDDKAHTFRTTRCSPDVVLLIQNNSQWIHQDIGIRKIEFQLFRLLYMCRYCIGSKIRWQKRKSTGLRMLKRAGVKSLLKTIFLYLKKSLLEQLKENFWIWYSKPIFFFVFHPFHRKRYSIILSVCVLYS